jgi:hypothetical protein
MPTTTSSSSLPFLAMPRFSKKILRLHFVLVTLVVVRMGWFIVWDTPATSTNNPPLSSSLNAFKQRRRMSIANQSSSQSSSSAAATIAQEAAAAAATVAHNTHNKSMALTHFQQVGYTNISDIAMEQLPTNTEIIQFYGAQPILVGTEDQCTVYRTQHVPNPWHRWMGVAGLFNTGTNLLAQLLQRNCIMPATAAGMEHVEDTILFQVPWGKHALATVSRNRTAPHYHDYNKDDGLAVVVVRHPFAWAHSMCHNPYIVEWEHNKTHCPNLSQPVSTWGHGGNLVQFYNTWYQAYVTQFPYPRIIVRLEDLTLRPESTIQQICTCAGGTLRNSTNFWHATSSAKSKHAGHTSTTGMVEAWHKTMQPYTTLRGGFSLSDYRIAQATIDPDLMNLFGYTMPSSAV